MLAVPEVQIKSSPDRLRRGEGTKLKITLTIPENFHIQAHKPAEEFLIPTELTFKKVEGLEMSEPIYPEPIKLVTSWSEVLLLVYEGNTEISVPIEVTKNAAPGKREIQGILSFQGCTPNLCLRPKVRKFTLTFSIL